MAVTNIRRNLLTMMLALSLGGCYQSRAYLEAPAVTEDTSSAVVAEAAEPQPLALPSRPLVYSGYQDTLPYAEGLTLRQAIRRALQFSPAVRAASIEVDARRAEALQAGLRPNPVLAGDVQNIGQDPQESTIELSQLFELGGKRLKRIRAAELEVGVAIWDFEAARLRIASDTAQTFVDVLASQDRIAILNDLLAVGGKLAGAVRERVKAGGSSPVEAQRAEIEVTRAKALLKSEEAFLEVAKRRLANFWGSQGIDFSTARGELGTTNHIPSAEQISAYLGSNPDIARWAEEMARRQAILAVTRANAVPDLTLGGGARRVEENEVTGAVVSLSIPLPLFNRNQGTIAAAQTRIAKGLSESLSAMIDVRNVLLEAYGRLVASAEKLRALEKDILPSAKEIYGAVSEGYSAGKFDLLSVLDAQRTLFSTRLEIINARAEFQKAKVQIEALIGRGLNEV